MVKHGESKTKLNKAWRNMKDRFYNPRNKRFHRYGGRGITVCLAWHNYEPFRDWAVSHGYSDGLSLDRIDNDGDYCPLNCRWVNSKVQNSNFSRNRNITYNGETHCISEWARILGIHRNTLDHRISSGWSVDEAFFTQADVANKSAKVRKSNLPGTIQLGDAFQVRDADWNLG